MPSETESFGLAALEAMAAGVPVISSNTGGIPEVNINGVTGFLSDVGDVDSMSENAISILRSKDKLNLFKKNALERAEFFSITKVLPMYEELYEKILHESKI